MSCGSKLKWAASFLWQPFIPMGPNFKGLNWISLISKDGILTHNEWSWGVLSVGDGALVCVLPDTSCLLLGCQFLTSPIAIPVGHDVTSVSCEPLTKENQYIRDDSQLPLNPIKTSIRVTPFQIIALKFCTCVQPWSGRFGQLHSMKVVLILHLAPVVAASVTNWTVVAVELLPVSTYTEKSFQASKKVQTIRKCRNPLLRC